MAYLYFSSKVLKPTTQTTQISCSVHRASRYNRVRKNQLDAQLILSIYFANLYIFQAYLGPSSEGTTVFVQQLVLILLR